MENNSEQISFNVETSRILEILSTEIYDSPHALLRENVQNGYDAILMRCQEETLDIKESEINIQIEDATLTISDDGIGMNEDVLRNNYWKAGSSGKKTELAQKSGVIGTFGIGAMANFGVCSKLIVETRHIHSDTTLTSIAIRDELKIAHECIELSKAKDDRTPGTKITATIDDVNFLNEQIVIKYLKPYVEFLPVAVKVNGNIISKKPYEESLVSQSTGYTSISNRQISNNIYSGTLNTSVNSLGHVLVRLTDIEYNGNKLIGEIFLIQNNGKIMGLRNFFGLAPIPISCHYQFGGIVNLQILVPTAGREALSRESIQHVNNLINLIELEVSVEISKTDSADKNINFQQHILTHGRFDLADNVTVNILPQRIDIPLKQLTKFEPHKKLYYYTGRDQTKIQTFGNEQSNLIHISQSNPRRKLQIGYVQRILKVNEIPNSVMIKDIPAAKLSIEEAMFLLKVKGVLSDDYLIFDTEVSFANMSDGVTFNVDKRENIVFIKIERNTPALNTVLECYYTARDVYIGFVKNFIREHLYQHIRNYVPSSTKEGRDALYNRLKMNKELYRLEEINYGEVESLLADFVGGKTNLGTILRTAKQRTSTQKQKVSSNNVASVEEEMPDIIGKNETTEEKNEFDAVPPIVRPKLPKSIKVLTVVDKHKTLNNFRMFLALSDILFKKEGEFLRFPHATKIIWATHRVIFIFTDETNTLSLYYDIDLKEPLEHDSTGGGAFPTTTIFTENRIFVPIPENLESAFRIVGESKEFLVRFDTIP